MNAEDRNEVRKIVAEEIAKAMHLLAVRSGENPSEMLSDSLKFVFPEYPYEPYPPAEEAVKLNPCSSCKLDDMVMLKCSRHEHLKFAAFVQCYRCHPEDVTRRVDSGKTAREASAAAMSAWNYANPTPSQQEERRFKPGQRFRHSKHGICTLISTDGGPCLLWGETFCASEPRRDIDFDRVQGERDGWPLAEIVYCPEMFEPIE